jgi:cell division transport system permease protein
MRALRYTLEEAIASLWRGRYSGLLSMATIAVALFVLGAFLDVTSNLQRLSSEWSNAAEMSVYLKDQVTPADRSAIEAVLTPGSVVAAREYVSKADALVRFKRTFGDLASATDGLSANPLPASYEVTLRTGPGVEERLDALAAALRQTAGVADVRYDRQWLTRLRSVVAVVSGVGLVLGGVLTIAAALTVANVVRLALYARRDELDIMQLVGAPQMYIRGPFVMEGLLQGGLGALVALAALGVAFFALRARYLAPMASALNLSSVHFLPIELCASLVAGGMIVGCLGGLVAAWKPQ